MSKFRYEVVEELCSDIVEYRPKYVVYNEKSIMKHLKNVYGSDDDKISEAFGIWRKYANEKPVKAVYDEKLNWCIKEGVIQEHSFTSLKEVFEAKRLGRMFPRHKQQIIYK